MKAIKNLSVRMKLIAGFGSILLISAVFALFMVNSISEFGTDVNTLESVQKELSVAKDLQINTLNMWQYVTDAALTKENSSLDRATEYLVKAKSDIDKLIDFRKGDS
ncbi:MAG: hypothetical protein WC061_02550, partial [Melioribacteraceae bacterium]